VPTAGKENVREAVAHQPRHGLASRYNRFVGDLFLQDRADGNHGGKRIPEDEELKKNSRLRATERGRKNDGDDPGELEHRSEQLKDPQVRRAKQPILP